MKKGTIVLYSTGKIFDKQLQTGGVKRFIELTKGIEDSCFDSILYSRDVDDVVRQNGIKNFKRLKNGKKFFRFIPPEFAILLSNLSIIKELKKKSYRNIVIFDVPTAIGPIVYGMKNVVLMIRKDMIGYENVQNKSKLKWLKICFQWLCEVVCMLKSKQIITQCVYDKDVLKKRHPFLAERIEKKTIVQINNVNPSWIVEKSKVGDTDDNVNKSSNLFRVCFIGGFDNPRKGQDLFLESAMEIIGKYDDIEFVLIGDGYRLDDYKLRYKHERITFMGRLDNPLPTLRNCNLLVVPSFADSCPNTVMEALYNEIPVIGSRAGGIPEILVNEESLFDLNSSSLTERIIYYKDNVDVMEKLALQQKERKEELTFNWAEKILSKII